MENTLAKYANREYRVPVQAANELAERLGHDLINHYSEQRIKYLIEFSREKKKMFEILKQISDKTIDFNIDNFKRERKRLLKPPPPPDILVPKKILQAVPVNCVLDFGPGNSIMYHGSSKYKQGVISRNSVLENPHKRNISRPRPFTAIPMQTRRPNPVALDRSGRNTSLGITGTFGRNSSLETPSTSSDPHSCNMSRPRPFTDIPRPTQTRRPNPVAFDRSGRNTSLGITGTSGRNSSLETSSNSSRKTRLHVRIPTSGLHRNNYINCVEEPDIEYNHKNGSKWEIPNRSFRQLKNLHTYTEEEKPDLTAERFKMMKIREKAHFRYLQGKVKEFRV